MKSNTGLVCVWRSVIVTPNLQKLTFTVFYKKVAVKSSQEKMQCRVSFLKLAIELQKRRYLFNWFKIDSKNTAVCNMHLGLVYLIIVHWAGTGGGEGVIFFLSGFSFAYIQIHRTAGEGGGYLVNSSLPLPPAYRHVDINRAITTESSSLHIARSRTRTRNLWFPSASR